MVKTSSARRQASSYHVLYLCSMSSVSFFKTANRIVNFWLHYFPHPFLEQCHAPECGNSHALENCLVRGNATKILDFLNQSISDHVITKTNQFILCFFRPIGGRFFDALLKWSSNSKLLPHLASNCRIAWRLPGLFDLSPA